MVAVAAQRQQGPQERQADAVPVDAQDQEVDVHEARLPVRTVWGEFNVTLRQKGNDQMDQNMIGQLTAHEALETLFAHFR